MQQAAVAAMTTFELQIVAQITPCVICQEPTEYRYKLDKRTRLIACSQNHAGKAYARINGIFIEQERKSDKPKKPRSTARITPDEKQPAREPRAAGHCNDATAGERKPGSHLAYLGPAERQSTNRRGWYRCDCGREMIKYVANVNSGNTKTCGQNGCPHSDELRKRKKGFI